MRDDHDIAAAIMERHGIEQRAEPKDHVAPALSTWRPVIEFSGQPPERSLLPIERGNAGGRKTIEHAEFLLAQAFVDADRRAFSRAAFVAKPFRGLLRAAVRRAQ